MSIITDGTGTGNKLKIDNDNRAKISGVTFSETHDATERGDSFFIATSTITLTNANESGIIYIKNNESTKLLHVTGFSVATGDSTGGSGTVLVKIYKNPTTGTLVSGATAVNINSNRNFSSSNELVANTYEGVQGSTITNGTTHSEGNLPSGIQATFPGDELLGRSNSIAVSLTPPTGNTSQDVTVTFAVYAEEPK